MRCEPAVLTPRRSKVRMFYGMFEGLAAVIAAMFAIYLIIAFILVYFAADGQGRRAGDRDPALGARIVTTFLLTITFQTALAGLALFLAAIFEGGPDMMVKLSIGLVVGAGVGSVLPLVVHKTRLPRLSGAATDRVARKAVGINAVLTGTASTAALMGVTTALIAGGDIQPRMIAVALVYTGGAALTVLGVSKGSPATLPPSA